MAPSRSFLQLLLISQYVISCLATLSFSLSPGTEFCIAFKTPGKEASRINGSFDVLNSHLALNPVTAVLFDYESEEVMWHSKPETSEGSFSIINSGKYHLCFGNGSGGYKTEEDRKRQTMKLQGHPSPEDDDFDYTNTDGENRDIGFSIRVTPLAGTQADLKQKENTEGDNEKAAKQSSQLTNLSYTLRDRMELLLDHQEYIKNREANHRHVVEETFTMVMKWTVLEAMVLMSVACAQVFYLKRFFETKRYL